MVKYLARAKVNLCLHIVGQRSDGMHLLDSIVVFPEIGDVLSGAAAHTLSLHIDGPFGQNLKGGADNLVLRAARAMSAPATALHLQKNLPLAAGIGGGSADCAATIRLLSDMWGIPHPAQDVLARLGADVPACMTAHPKRMQGIGDILAPLPALPDFWIVLVNADQSVATSTVFTALDKRQNVGISDLPSNFANTPEFFAFLSKQRNDMCRAAVTICPIIQDVLTELQAVENCALARMSGSGGTCFGLFEQPDTAQAAAQEIQERHPDWWVEMAKV
ncbi:MAG: 4-(cytidine 5'-diphospho)-2-C-methyl-D-erythritol kinase [Paracoccaceae bacterium]